MKTVDEYIGSTPKEAQDKLRELRVVIKEIIPEAEETISYQIPTFKINGKYVVYIAAFKDHVSLYPFTADMMSSFKEAAKYKTSGKGTIQFPLNKPLPMKFIRKIIAALLEKSNKRK